MSFIFAMRSQVSIEVSGEHGIVVGRAEYLNGEDQYLVRYCNKEGTAVEQWWAESALQSEVLPIKDAGK